MACPEDMNKEQRTLLPQYIYSRHFLKNFSGILFYFIYCFYLLLLQYAFLLMRAFLMSTVG